jgi:hypothetical protein
MKVSTPDPEDPIEALKLLYLILIHRLRNPACSPTGIGEIEVLPHFSGGLVGGR